MKTSDFYYDLPEELIAQTPIEPRDHSRLMVLDKKTGSIGHRHFYDIIEFLDPGDCLILNDSRVLPARIYGIKEGTGSQVEFLLLTHKEENVWEVLAGPGKKAKPGARFIFGNGLLKAEAVSYTHLDVYKRQRHNSRPWARKSYPGKYPQNQNSRRIRPFACE